MGVDGSGTAVVAAVAAFSTAADHLVKAVEDGGFDDLDQDGLLALARSFEQVRHRTALVDHRLVADLERRGTAAALAQPSTAALLGWLLRLSRGEARSSTRWPGRASS